MKGIGDKTRTYDSGQVKCVTYSIPMPIHKLVLGTSNSDSVILYLEILSSSPLQYNLCFIKLNSLLITQKDNITFCLCTTLCLNSAFLEKSE